MSTITRTDLKKLLDGPEPPLLIDVTPAEYFNAAHLPGAVNFCVYEVAFLDHVSGAAPDKAASIVAYGSSSHSLASATAAEKLARAGYAHALDFRGGLEEWQHAGFPVEKTAAPPPDPKPADGRHEIDPAKSHLQWTGRNLTSAHTGTISLKGGWIEVKNGQAAGGEITLDMESIADTDLADGALNRMLIAHLKSEDFFDTARHPTATFELRHVILNPRAHTGSVNAEIVGALTMKGITHELAFPAIVEALAGGALGAEAHFDIDRTRWNVLYGSGKFYERLGMHLVHDAISISLRIVTR